MHQVQRMESIGTPAGGITHDFNNPICAIRADAELAMLDLESSHPAYESIDGIVKLPERVTSLVSQIMTFSRHRTPVRTVVSLSPTVKEAVHMLRSLIPATVDMSCQIETNLPHVMADPGPIHQVVVNLCTNAWHALRDGRGRIKLVLKPVTGEVKTDRPIGGRSGQCVLLEVTDNGKGMSQETQR